jgi:DNA polymerase-1
LTSELSEEGKKLVLVDAYSLLFRAFFSGRYLSTTDNRPTGALFGFTNMLFTLLNNEKPDAIVVCWDAPHRTHRSQAFEAYKAHRPPIDPQLQAQQAPAREIVAAFGIQSVEEPGFEADDLIGTLAVEGKAKGYQVIILTGDSDQLQLVNDKVHVQITQRGVSEVKVYDADAVRERYGIGPEQIADFKALTGDSSDNIPGVPGIGDKTASALLQKFGTLDALLAAVEKNVEKQDEKHDPPITPPKAKAALEANLEQARFSKQLATIVCDVPMKDFTIKPYAPSDADWQRVRNLFHNLEFKSLLGRIPGTGRTESGTDENSGEERATPEVTFSAVAIAIQSQGEWEDALAAVRKSGTAGIRYETDGELPMRAKLKGLAFAPTKEVSYYVRVRETASAALPAVSPASMGAQGGLFDVEEQKAEDIRLKAEEDGFALSLDDLRPLFEEANISKISYNVKPLEIILERGGIGVTPFTFDVLIAAYLLEAGRSSYPLFDLAETHLDAVVEADDAYVEGAMLMQEAALCVALVPPLRDALNKVHMTAIMDDMEIPLVPVLCAMEEEGLAVNVPYLSTLGERMGGQLDALAETIYTLAGERFNIGSTKKLQEILFEKLQLPSGKKTKTGYSTGADVLEALAPEHEIASKIIAWREIAKLKATYADALIRLINPTTGRVHTSLNQTVTTSGRLSSSDPNLQNIPVRSEIGREIRQAFIAPPGKRLLSCDYSQVELRLLAHVTKDPTLTQAFQADEDIHKATAATVFNVPLEEVTSDQRRQAKTINFAVIYGQSGFALAATLGVGTSVATTWIKEYFDRLPGVKKYIDDTAALAHRQKYVQTLSGRRRYVPELDSGNAQVRQAAERAAVNMPIQGTAADIMKIAMIAVQKYLQETCGSDCTLLLQVHDELLFEVEADMVPVVTPEIKRLMEAAFPLDVPLRADAKSGLSWAEMSPVETKI